MRSKLDIQDKTASAQRSGDVDQDLADRAPLDRVVGRRGRLERVVVQRQPGVTSANAIGADTLARAFQSVGFTPDRTSRTRTWPGPGSGTGRSASRMTLDGPFSA
jgi:hypothetical protein